MQKENISTYLQIIIAGIIISFTPILVKFGESIGPYNLAFFRTSLGALFLGIYFLFFRKKLSPLKKDIKKMILFGAIHGIIILLYFYAISKLPVSIAVILLYLFPAWIIIFSHFILGEKISKKGLIGLLISFVGIILILSPRNFLEGSILGYLAGAIAGMLAGLIYVLSKTFKNYNKTSLTFWQNLIATPFLLPLLFLDFPKFSIGNTLIASSVGIIGIIYFILIYSSLGKIKTSHAGNLMLLDVIWPAFFAFILLKEIPEITTIIGILIIMVGTYFVVNE
ncbi:DMT family transporter [Candidatus Pacearchaeota archaeon]|nr:DMT family transporter [Candidatus Pacearchaeota archaeon]